jgi:uncharacterized membrane-anchored protein YhcB (DUF1043 family)
MGIASVTGKLNDISNSKYPLGEGSLIQTLDIGADIIERWCNSVELILDETQYQMTEAISDIESIFCQLDEHYGRTVGLPQNLYQGLDEIRMTSVTSSAQMEGMKTSMKKLPPATRKFKRASKKGTQVAGRITELISDFGERLSGLLVRGTEELELLN